MKHVNAFRTAFATLCVALIGFSAGGCDSSSDPMGPDRNADGKNLRDVYAMQDSTVLNNTGFRHNEVMNMQWPYLESLDPATRTQVGTVEPISYQHIPMRVQAQARGMADFAGRPMAIAPTFYTPIFTRLSQNATLASFRAYLDSLRLALGFGPYYIEVYDSLENIFVNSPTPAADFEGYLRRQLARPLTEKEEGYLRIGVSVCRESRLWWEGNPNRPMSKGYSVSGVTAVPAWAVIDGVGALAGALGSLWSQRNNQNIDWWEVGGQAVIWGATGSLGQKIISKYGLK